MESPNGSSRSSTRSSTSRKLSTFGYLKRPRMLTLNPEVLELPTTQQRHSVQPGGYEQSQTQQRHSMQPGSYEQSQRNSRRRIGPAPWEIVTPAQQPLVPAPVVPAIAEKRKTWSFMKKSNAIAAH